MIQARLDQVKFSAVPITSEEFDSLAEIDSNLSLNERVQRFRLVRAIKYYYPPYEQFRTFLDFIRLGLINGYLDEPSPMLQPSIINLLMHAEEYLDPSAQIPNHEGITLECSPTVNSNPNCGKTIIYLDENSCTVTLTDELGHEFGFGYDLKETELEIAWGNYYLDSAIIELED